MEGIEIISFVPADVKPFFMKEFNSIDEAFTFYNVYARICGFGVRKGTQRFLAKESNLIWQVFLCSKEGLRDGKRDKQKKTITHVGCETRMEVRKKKESRTHYVTKFIEVHNHAMMTPSKVYVLRSQKHMDEGAKRLIKKWSESGLGTPNIMSILSNEARGIIGIGFDEDQCKSYIQKLKKQTYGNDGTMNAFEDCGLSLGDYGPTEEYD